MSSATASSELRFGFGKNWKRFLHGLNDEKIDRATADLKELLCVSDLKGMTFLDIGSGSGLSSLAAIRLGASVVAFDYDQDSVECSEALRKAQGIDESHWSIAKGSVLDADYLKTLGSFDIVYSWGVLHHTGSMWQALENLAPLVKPQGILSVALYNDQGWASDAWKIIKRLYCSSAVLAWIITCFFASYWAAVGLVADLFYYRKNPLKRYGMQERGMSRLTDLHDWLGGYPFEVAGTGEVFRFYRDRGFELVNLKSVGAGLACNEFVFKKA